MPRVLYGVPTGGHPHPAFVLSLRDIEVTTRLSERRPGDFEFARGPVQMSRSHIATNFIQGTWDYLLMHDDDLAVNPHGPVGNPIDAFIKHMDATPTCGMIGAIYLRENPQIPLVNMWHPDYATGDYRRREMMSAVAGFPNLPFKVASVGTGFVLIRRQALLDVHNQRAGNGGPVFRFAVEEDRNGMMREVGEDYDFCARLHNAGWEVWADPRIPTIHFKESGRLTYEWAQWENQGSIALTVQPGASLKFLPVGENQVQCIDVSEVRNAEARAYRERQQCDVAYVANEAA